MANLITIVVRPFSQAVGLNPTIRSGLLRNLSLNAADSTNASDSAFYTGGSGELYSFLLNLYIFHNILFTSLIPRDGIRMLKAKTEYLNSYDAEWNGGVIIMKSKGLCNSFNGLKVVWYHYSLDKSWFVLKKNPCEPIIIWLTLCHPNIQPIIGLLENEGIDVATPWVGYRDILAAIHGTAKVQPQELLSSIDTWVLLLPLVLALWCIPLITMWQIKQIASGISHLHSRKVVHGSLRGVCIYRWHQFLCANSHLRNPSSSMLVAWLVLVSPPLQLRMSL